jgi:NTE family protein
MLSAAAARILALPLLLMLALLAPATIAEQRVGLVLAGGGARGLAHIGVIRYLEEHNIRVHAIAGTSMGSIIGGLYASGLDAAELERVARNIDWRYAFDDQTPREQLSFRRKQDDFDYLIAARLRFKQGRLKLPMGAIEGQHLNLLLHDLVNHVSRVEDFDALPIPFRAVASDIVTGEAVVLARGDLAMAMRASMSIPGVFAPIAIGEQILVDGGIAKNIPVDVVQAMGVDRLIVVDVGTPLAPREKLDSALALIDQLTNIMTRTNSEQQLALMNEGDVLLRPALDANEITSMSFDKTDQAIALGYEAARTMSAELAVLAGSDKRVRLAQKPKSVRPRIDRIEVQTDAALSSELLRNMINQPLGKRLDKKQLESDIANIYGLDEFSRVDYSIEEHDSQNVLRLRATANPAGSSYLKLGMRWDQDSRGSSEFGLRASWRQKGINRLGAEWYTIGQLGGLSLFGSEFYQPLDVQRRLFVASHYHYQQRQLNLSEDGKLRARAVLDNHLVELAPGINIGNSAALRSGVFAGTSDTDIQLGSPLLSSISADDAGYFVELKYDTLDRPFFSGNGTRLTSRYAEGMRDWGADSNYESWSTSMYRSFSLGRNSFTALARWSQLDIGSTDNASPASSVLLPSQIFTLGGFQQLSGYTRDSLAGNYLGLASLSFYRRLTEQSLLPVDFPVYAGASIEAGNTWLFKDDVAFDGLLYAGSVFLGIDSPLGPVYLGAGFGEDNQRALYLQIGQLID